MLIGQLNRSDIIMYNVNSYKTAVMMGDFLVLTESLQSLTRRYATRLFTKRHDIKFPEDANVKTQWR